MEQSNQIQTAQASTTNLTVFTPQLNKLLQVISEPAREVIKARHSGAMFSEMGTANLITSAQLILADLKLLSGLKIPTGNAFDRMTKLFAESLKEDYPFYTVPLVQIAMKKHVNVITTGKEKSYGRDLSIADFHQIMDAYSKQVQEANKEVDEVLSKQVEEKIISEGEKQNIIRKGIQEQFEAGNMECTFVEFNQLLKDGLITEEACNKAGWKAIKSLKEKYIKLSQATELKSSKDPESIGGLLQKRNLSEKIQLLTEIEDAVKGEVASLYLQHCKQKGMNIYEPLI